MRGVSFRKGTLAFLIVCGLWIGVPILVPAPVFIPVSLRVAGEARPPALISAPVFALVLDLHSALASVGTGVLMAQAPGAGLHVEVGVDPAQVRIGEPFRGVVRVVAPRARAVEIGEFVSTDTVSLVGPVETGSDSAGARAAVFPLAAWVTGNSLSSSIPIRITDSDGSSRVVYVTLRLPEVVPVLPAGEGGDAITPRPVRGLLPVHPSTSTGFPWWLLLLALLAALAAGIVVWRRRRDGGVVPDLSPDEDPRRWALAQLGVAASSTSSDSFDAAEFITHVSRIVRIYLGRVRPDLGEDLTTTEVLGAARKEPDLSVPLRTILDAADRVKFARHQPSVAEAEQLLRDASRWVSVYPPPIAVSNTGLVVGSNPDPNIRRTSDPASGSLSAPDADGRSPGSASRVREPGSSFRESSGSGQQREGAE
ncbi:MAG: hypothetical protein LBG44_06695 [Gemmatimonadota bacterium]|nr:hypothetical protein [Gemmatimonadota bacterium]